jgi:hypothetical protein
VVTEGKIRRKTDGESTRFSEKEHVKNVLLGSSPETSKRRSEFLSKRTVGHE